MSDVVVGSGEIDCWREVVPVQHEDRQLTVQVLFRTLKYSAAAKEYHVKLTSEEDDCFLYRTVITPEENRRLMLSHSMNISFDQLPEYFRQLLKAVKHEGEYGERYFINVLAQNTPGLAARIELLITMRQAGYVVQNKRLCLPFTLASDSDFKEHLIGCFDKIKKEKEQLRRSVALLETQLRDERVRSHELEDKNRWLQKELEFSQGLLKSAENIQKHYESLLSQKHRGEIGGSVLVKIEDSIVSGDGVANSSGLFTGGGILGHASQSLSFSSDKDSSLIPNRTTEGDSNSGDGDDHRRSPAISTEEDNAAANQISMLESHDHGDRCSPTLGVNTLGQLSTTSAMTNSSTMSSLTTSTSPGDKKPLKGAAKRKASFHNYNTNPNGGTSSSTSTTATTTTIASSNSNGEPGEIDEKPTAEQTHRPPPRKFAAAMVQVDSQLIQIRREQEQQQRKIEDDEEAEEAKSSRYSPANSSAENAATTSSTTTTTTTPPPPAQAPSTTAITIAGNDPILTAAAVAAGRQETKEERTPAIPPRPFSHPPVLVLPVNQQQQHPQSFAAPPPPPMHSAHSAPLPVQMALSSGHHLPTSWHVVNNSPSLPVVSGLPISMAAAFAGQHDFAGLGVSSYILPTISSVTGGVVTPMASSTATTSAYDSMTGSFDDYNNHVNDSFGRNITESAEVLNDRLTDDISSDAWAMIPKSEPNDYQDDRLSDTCSRDSSAAMRNGGASSVGAQMMHRHLMSTVTMNENSMGGGSDSPAPGGTMTGSYSASASPSLSTSSADGIDGVISYLKCLICERSFGQEGAAVHMAQHITDPQRCTICTEMPPFPSRDELIKHMIGHCARAYACRYCGKENPRVHYLKIHVRSHTGEKPYTCLQCGRGFADASTWRRHERVHTGEKPYECTICGRRIARRDNVKIHMRSHMRSKVQMSCRTCGKVFAQPNHLVLHERMCGGAAGGVGGELKPGSTSSASSADIPIVD